MNNAHATGWKEKAAGQSWEQQMMRRCDAEPNKGEMNTDRQDFMVVDQVLAARNATLALAL